MIDGIEVDEVRLITSSTIGDYHFVMVIPCEICEFSGQSVQCGERYSMRFTQDMDAAAYAENSQVDQAYVVSKEEGIQNCTPSSNFTNVYN